MAEQQSTLVPNAIDGFINLPIFRQAGLLVGVAASIAIGVAVALWAQKPDMRALFTGLDEKDAGEVAEALSTMGITYRIDPANGTLLVDGNKIYETRLKLASQGLPHGSTSSFESLGKETNFGTSQFMEQAMFRHALENELARTISSLDSVRSARVHLAVPRQSIFLRDSRTPSASVLVDLYNGRSLTKSQVSAITNLVASSVPDMQSSDVTLVDQKGRLLSEENGADISSQTAKQFEIQKQVEDAYVKRILSLLIPILGDSHIKAEVNADIDFTASEKTSEIFSPEQQVIRSEQTIEEYQNGAQHNAPGVPGALSNSPVNNQGQGANGAAGAGANGDTRKRDVRTYEVGKTVSHTIQQPWVIKRISVAVAVDDVDKVDARGNSIKAPVSQDKIQQISGLIKEAVGFSSERGDSVNVINLSFADTPKVDPLPEEPFWTQNWFLEIMRYAFAAASVLFLVFAVLRPMLKSLAQGRTVPSNQLIPAPTQNVAERDVAGSEETLNIPRLPEASGAELASIEVVRNMVQQDPARVAQVIMNWVGNDDE